MLLSLVLSLTTSQVQVKATCGDAMVTIESSADAANAIDLASANVVKKLAARWCP